MNAPLSHAATMSLWNVAKDCEQITEVRTFWFDDEAAAKAFSSTLDGDVRFFRQPRSSLGAFRVVSYRPAQ